MFISEDAARKVLVRLRPGCEIEEDAVRYFQKKLKAATREMGEEIMRVSDETLTNPNNRKAERRRVDVDTVMRGLANWQLLVAERAKTRLR
ncbi:MAG TPA: hypothetical protein VM327_03145 [Candidatus Thermoplasmatota archaeon]|nr:hypothetical protein [Candidatus Thermoplasmatota archaeon]